MPFFSIKMYTLNIILITSEVFHNDTGIFLIKFILKNKLLKIAKSILKLQMWMIYLIKYQALCNVIAMQGKQGSTNISPRDWDIWKKRKLSLETLREGSQGAPHIDIQRWGNPLAHGCLGWQLTGKLNYLEGILPK